MSPLDAKIAKLGMDITRLFHNREKERAQQQMEYEFKAKLLEKELEQQREMLLMQRERMDILDKSQEKILAICQRTTVNLEALTQKVDKLTDKVEKLVSAMLVRQGGGTDGSM